MPFNSAPLYNVISMTTNIDPVWLMFALWLPGLTHVWLMLDPCFTHVWLIFDSCLTYVWLMFDSYLTHVLLIFKSCLTNVWNFLTLVWLLFDSFLTQVWFIFDSRLTHVWTMFTHFDPRLPSYQGLAYCWPVTLCCKIWLL